jgi:Tat protein translocase TatB subunit
MGNVGGPEILVILLAALLFLGPQKLPDAARQLGRALGEFRKMTAGFQRELHDALGDERDAETQARERGAAVAATRPDPLAGTKPVDSMPLATAAADSTPEVVTSADLTSAVTPSPVTPPELPAERTVEQPGGDL